MSTAVKTKRVLSVETWYPDFIKLHPLPEGTSYDAALSSMLSLGFGTAAIYSANLRRLGWEAIDVVANHVGLQWRWASENDAPDADSTILWSQILKYQPSVVFCHDLSYISVTTLNLIRSKGILLAGQCSCPMPDLDKVARFDVLFTSFPHYVKKLESLGVKAFYVPLGFDETVLDQINTSGERPHDCVFVGGVGMPGHWAYGMQVLNAIAESIPTFKWWGYGAPLLPKSSPLRQRYCGSAWGLEMYSILAKSKIALARHGEVAAGYSNNMKMFETSGMGALLMTEASLNLSQFFGPDEAVAYTSAAEAAGLVKYYLEHDAERRNIAAAGQRRTLTQHTYYKRIEMVADALDQLL